MAPRGRHRKVGLKRIDAAVDALLPLGFSKALIRKTVDALLKVYGGDSGWVFIEEASYKLLIETILEEEQILKKDSCEDLANALGISEPTAGALIDEVARIGGATTDPGIVEPITERGLQEEGGWKGISCDKKLPSNDHEARLSCSEHVRSPSCRRRRPCYGWISDDESEEKDGRLENQSPQVHNFFQRMEDFGRERKRRTRWDVKPDIL